MIPPHLSQSSCGTSAGAATSANNGTVALSDSQTRQKRGNATSDLQESGVDTSSELPFGAVKHRVWSPVSLCCGFDIRQPFMEPQVEQSPDFQDIAVYTSGSFPCLHIALRGLRPDHAYYLAIDFEEVMAGDEDKWAPQYAAARQREEPFRDRHSSEPKHEPREPGVGDAARCRHIFAIAPAEKGAIMST
ncbi:hypothetical protein HPB51_013352 [Rhipicephalus microplus]|uniref:Uncharacterized protein n=1 Tax=Rhipicephalus microplus TaxID=6941 RepID=A0A9J6EH96_RHIMP|nr:hypothetical protein HPB51_013352 [Rhipicephalus microplus]